MNASYIQQTLNNVYSHNSTRVFWQRPKIEWLVYGQSSTYKAFQDNPDYFFYSFNNVAGQRYPDGQWNGGKDVLYCSQPNLGPGARMVLSRLKANTEQSRAEYNGSINQWHADNQCTWYVKPRIRINPTFAKNNPYAEVCKVYVIKQDGSNKITPVAILAGNFLVDPNLEYNGRYLEEFNFDYPSQGIPRGVNFPGTLGDKWYYAARGECDTDPAWLGNRSDIKIEWLDNCDMWIDYVKVENDVANRLLKQNDPVFEQWILEEVNAVKDPPPGGTEPVVYNYYIELFEFNNIPCMAYVNQKIREYSLNKIGFMADLLCFYQTHLPWRDLGIITTPEKLKRMFFDVTNFKQVFIGDPYPITASIPLGCDGTEPQYNLIPNTFGVVPNNYSMFTLASPQNYDAWLQALLDTTCIFYEGGSYPPGNNSLLIGDFRYLMKHGNQMSSQCDIPFIAMLQAHQWNLDGEIDREPTNEEQNLMVNEAVSYGAKGIIFWGWGSFHDQSDPDCKYALGITGENGLPRQQNVYGQQKWDEFKKITERLEKWGPTLMKFKNNEIKSYIYRYPLERSRIIGGCVRDVFTYEPNCPGSDYISTPEPENNRYIQLATFDELHTTSDVNERYFMVVNKRCSPHTQNDCGGLRRVKIKLGDFNTPCASGFLRFRNLNLIDVEAGNTVVTFDKQQNNGTPLIDLGWFEPGQGKLYKIAPTLLTGGTLVAEENVIYDENNAYLYLNEYDVTGTVYSGGHTIDINNLITFNFHENTGFVADNSQLYLGVGGGTAVYRAVNGAKWNGITANNSQQVDVEGITFSDVKDGNYALNLTNSGRNFIFYNTFNYSNGSTIAGGVNINSSLSTNPQQIIYLCTFNMSASNMQAVNIVSSPHSSRIAFDYNNISRSYSGVSIGMFLEGCTGQIKNCYLNQPAQGIVAVNSNLDIYHNQVYGNESIYGTAYSYLNMAPSGPVQLAGGNTMGYGHRNIVVLNSRFNMLNGSNSFNVAGNYDDRHLLGYYPAGDKITSIDVSGNCFYVNNSASSPLHYITLGSGGQQINVIYNGGSNCANQQGDIAFITPSGYSGYSDTVYQSAAQNSELDEASILLKQISIASRKHEHDSVITKATAYLNNYPDSIGSTEAVEEMFYSSLLLDNNGNKIQPLKSQYETLVMNNPNNNTLVNMLYYYIQKCKVSLGQYSSALSGFQQIINQNPYSYEGLIASWDYMSTYLLDSIGSGGGESGEDNKTGDDITIRDDFDRKLFNDKDRGSIIQNITNALQNSKNIQVNEVNNLMEKEKSGDLEAAKKLKTKQALKETVKVQKPKDNSEYLQIVGNDIKRVFSIGDQIESTEKKISNIPYVYKLSQNYPNPFNPVTKINYDLPRDSKVNIVIYDILGREVRRLLNNEIKSAGSYVVDFNASNYASGVYFYRIEAEEPNGNKFVDSKKMVLLK